MFVAFGPLTEGCHNVQSDADVLERLHVRVAAHGLPRRLRRVRGGAGRVPAADEVHRQLGGVVGGRRAISILQAATDLQVEPGTALGRHAFVDHFLVQVVVELEAGRDGAIGPGVFTGGGEEQRPARELRAAGLALLRIDPQGCGDGCRGELPTRDRRGFEQFLVGGGGAHQALLDELPERSRDGRGQLTCVDRGRAGVAVDGDQPLHEPFVDEALQVQRVAGGAAVGDAHQLGRRFRTAAPTHELCGCAFLEWRHLHLGQGTVEPKVVQHVGQARRRPRQLLGPARDQDEQASRGATATESGKDVDGRGVAPLQVLEDQHHWIHRSQGFERLHDLPEHPVPGAAEHPTSKPVELVVGHQPGHLHQPRRGPIRQEFDERRAVGQRGGFGEGLEQREVGLAGPPILDALPRQQPETGAPPLCRHRVDQQRLPHTGLAAHDDHTPPAGDDVVHAPGEHLLLRFATERRHPGGGIVAGRISAPVRVGDEPVATSVHGADDALEAPVVAHRPPHVLDAGRQRRLRDEAGLPHLVEELLLGNHAITVLEEVDEHVVHLGFDADHIAVPAELVGVGVELAPGEHVDHVDSDRAHDPPRPQR